MDGAAARARRRFSGAAQRLARPGSRPAAALARVPAALLGASTECGAGSDARTRGTGEAPHAAARRRGLPCACLPEIALLTEKERALSAETARCRLPPTELIPTAFSIDCGWVLGILAIRTRALRVLRLGCRLASQTPRPGGTEPVLPDSAARRATCGPIPQGGRRVEGVASPPFPGSRRPSCCASASFRVRDPAGRRKSPDRACPSFSSDCKRLAAGPIDAQYERRQPLTRESR